MKEHLILLLSIFCHTFFITPDFQGNSHNKLGKTVLYYHFNMLWWTYGGLWCLLDPRWTQARCSKHLYSWVFYLCRWNSQKDEIEMENSYELTEMYSNLRGFRKCLSAFEISTVYSIPLMRMIARNWITGATI